MAITQVTKASETISAGWDKYNATVTALLIEHASTGAHGVITATSLATTTISGLTSLTAAGNLDIGAYGFRAATLTADGLTATRVIFAGTNGLLSSDADMTFVTDTLTVAKASIGAVGIGTTTIPHGGVGTAMLALEGANASANGPHVQFTTASDDYPLIQIWPWTHDNMNIFFDTYFDGTTYVSSDAGSNFAIEKAGDKLSIRYDSGIAVTTAITWNNGIVLDTAGLVTLQAAKLKVGATTPSAVQWGALGALVEWTAWVPTLTGDADLSGYTHARYYRIGNICFFEFSAEGKNVTTSGTIQITLPFTHANTGIVGLSGVVQDGTAWVGYTHVNIPTNTNYITVHKTAAAGPWVGNETGVTLRLSGHFEIA